MTRSVRVERTGRYGTKGRKGSGKRESASNGGGGGGGRSTEMINASRSPPFALQPLPTYPTRSPAFLYSTYLPTYLPPRPRSALDSRNFRPGARENALVRVMPRTLPRPKISPLPPIQLSFSLSLCLSSPALPLSPSLNYSVRFGALFVPPSG